MEITQCRPVEYMRFLDQHVSTIASTEVSTQRIMKKEMMESPSGLLVMDPFMNHSIWWYLFQPLLIDWSFYFFFCFIGSFAANKSWHKIRISATSHSVHGIRGRWLAHILPLIHKLLYNFFSIFQKQTIIPRLRTIIFRWAPNWKQPILLPTLQMLMVAHKRNANTPGRSWPSQHAAKLVEVEIFI